jgi:gluconokinase
MSPFSKLVWLRAEHPEIFWKDTRFISIKEYVFYKMFGKFIVDYSTASATGLFNLKMLDWDEEALKVAGVTRDQHSKLVPTTEILTGAYEEHSKFMGVDKKTPFVVGASDGVLSNLGVNVIEPGVITATIGTKTNPPVVVNFNKHFIGKTVKDVPLK